MDLKPIFIDSNIEASTFVSGQWVSDGPKQSIISPYSGKELGKLIPTSRALFDKAIAGAQLGFNEWSQVPIKERCQILLNARDLLMTNKAQLSSVIAGESGKLVSEAEAGLMKGIEVLDFAISTQNLDKGGKMQVSRGVTCEDRREPLGIVAGITPFNFPAMVPMWMIPLALVTGNAFVWKPSDKTPLTSKLIADLFRKAGLPDGVLTVIQGGKDPVEWICDHPEIKAVGFVGSSPIAKLVYERCAKAGKRALALGGAKNPVFLMPDADPEVSIPGIVASYTGCAGQRCMAASLLLVVGESSNQEKMIQSVIEKSSQMKCGVDMGAIITEASLNRLNASVDVALRDGAKIALDGRMNLDRPGNGIVASNAGAKSGVNGTLPADYAGGLWMAPTVFDNVKWGSSASCDELFGPVLSIVRVKSFSEAIEMERSLPYGNAASIFTTSGATAETFSRRVKAGMVGINVGVPVPREPFAFGGTHASRFGHGDITGENGLDFWTFRRKITMKWTLEKDRNWMS